MNRYKFNADHNSVTFVISHGNSRTRQNSSHKVLPSEKSLQLSFFLGLSFLLEHKVLLRVRIYPDMLEHISSQNCAALRRSSKQGVRQENKE